MISLVLAVALLAPGAVGNPAYSGDANFANPSHGGNYLAMRLPKGTIVNICGAGGCWNNARVNDYGPVEATGDIADLAFVKFMKVCGYNREEARRMGECVISVEVVRQELPLPPTDTDPSYFEFSGPSPIQTLVLLGVALSLVLLPVRAFRRWLQ